MRRGDPFDDWFNGSEGYGLRSERLFESLPALTNYETQYIITWLRAAYDEGARRGRPQGSVASLFTATAEEDPPVSPPFPTGSPPCPPLVGDGNARNYIFLFLYFIFNLFVASCLSA